MHRRRSCSYSCSTSLLLLLLLLLQQLGTNTLTLGLALASTTDKRQTTHSQPVDFAVGCTGDDAHTPNTNTSFRVHHHNAQFLVIHFAFAKLDSSASIEILDASKSAVSAEHNYRHTSPRVLQTYDRASVSAVEFFTPPLYANDIEIRYSTNIAAARDDTDPSDCFGFRIDEYRFAATSASLQSPKVKAAADDVPVEACTKSEATSTDAACLTFDPEVVEAARPVARLLIQKPLGAIFCTGWLLGCEGHVLTNHHCVSQESEANATSIEFMAQGSTCAQECDSPMLCPGHVVAASAQIIAFSPESDLDYVLLLPRLSPAQLQAVVADYGFLSLRASDAMRDEHIFIPQHPAGCGKRVALKYAASYGRIESLAEPSCNARNDNIGYLLGTQGGSSGAPVIASTDMSVVGLHYCGACRNSAIPAREIVRSLAVANALPACAVSEQQWPPVALDGTDTA